VLNLAYDGLAGVEAKSKHIIVLTDGQAPGGDYAPAIQRIQAAGVTLSTIGIGFQGDTQLLQQLAQQGNGAYYDGSDPFNLPQLVVKETQQLQRAAIVEQATQPEVVSPNPVLDGIDAQQLPALRGYVATTAKPESNVVLATPSLDPLLVEWQSGLGRVISWTSDATNRWSADWLNSAQYQPFWAQLVKRTIRPPDDPNRQITVRLEGDQARITLDALNGAEGADRQYVNFLPTTADIVDPRGTQVHLALPQVAPGEYQAALPAETDGVYTVQVTETNPDSSVATQSSGFVVPYSPEYRDLATNDTLLSSLADQTGGSPIQTPDQALAHDLPSVEASQPIFPQLLMLLALVLVLDVGVRRLQFSAFALGVRVRAVRRRLGYIDELPLASRLPAAPAMSLVHTVYGPRTAQHRVDELVTPAPGGRSSHASSRSSQLLAAKRRVSRQ
jgi:hypothetical protein